LDEQEESHTANIEVNVKEFEDEIIKMIHEES
jgi:hypothetical protein